MLIPCSTTFYSFCFLYKGFLFFILISHSLQLFPTSRITQLILPVDLEFSRSTVSCGMVLLTYLIRWAQQLEFMSSKFSALSISIVRRFLRLHNRKIPGKFPPISDDGKRVEIVNLHVKQNTMLGAAHGWKTEQQIYTELETSALTFPTAEILP
jgi:hypothetical protein